MMMSSTNGGRESCESSKKQLLVKLRYQYGRNENTSDTLRAYFALVSPQVPETSECFTQEQQQLQADLIDFVLHNKYLTKYEPSMKAKRSLLKSTIDIVESSGQEVDERLLDAYINMINSNITSDKHFVVLFSLNDESEPPVVIEQSTTIIANGTTGLHVWPACFHLISYLSRNVHLLSNKTILELGSGLGLLGLKCARLADVNKFIFTDYHELVLAQLRANIGYNCDMQIGEGRLDETTKLSAIELDWMDIAKSWSKSMQGEHIDMVLASDIVYDPELIPHLVETLDFICSSSSQRNPNNLEIYISSTIRNNDTYRLFLNNLEAKSFSYEAVNKDKAPTKSSQIEILCPVEILKIAKSDKATMEK